VTYTTGRTGLHTCIGFDNYASAVRITEHLLDLRHRVFAMIVHNSDDNDRIQQRVAGVRDTLAHAGIAIRPRHLVRADSRHIASGRDGMRQILADAECRPTALICTNDYIATGAMIEAKVLQLSIPGDLSIVGFDDTDMSAHLDPPLTDDPGARTQDGKRDRPLTSSRISNKVLSSHHLRLKRISSYAAAPRGPGPIPGIRTIDACLLRHPRG